MCANKMHIIYCARRRVNEMVQVFNCSLGIITTLKILAEFFYTSAALVVQ